MFDAIRRAIAGLLPDPKPVAPVIAPIEIKCTLCGSAFAWTADEQRHFAAKGYVKPSRCRSCRAWRRAPRATRGPAPGTENKTIIVCHSCRRPFTISPKRRQWLAMRGYALPRRCNNCRKPMHTPTANLIAQLEALQTESVLTGHPSAEIISAALISNDASEMRRALDAVRGQGR